MPDLPHDGLLRVLTGHTMAVEVLVIAPDGTWLASAGNDGTVRIWDPDTGQTRHTLTGHTRPIRTMALRYDRTFMRPMLPTA
jgi:WD40 repeat protein